MFGFNRVQAQAVLDAQVEVLAALETLTVLVDLIAQEKGFDKEAAKRLTDRIENDLRTRRKVLEGVFA